MSKNAAEDDSSDVECPTCGRDDFASEGGMKNHHKVVHGESIAGIEVECANCGKVLKRKPYQVEKHERSFCNHSCNGKWHNGERSSDYAKEKVDCAHCGAELLRQPHRLNNGSRQFCNQDCRADWQSENLVGENHPLYASITVECAYCGTTLIREPNQVMGVENSFCNQSCHDSWRSKNVRGQNHFDYESVEVPCANCGTILKRQPHRLAEGEQFCNQECHYERHRGENHPLWSGGVLPYGKGWNEHKRELVRERDGRECRICGKPEEEHIAERDEKHTVHHIAKARRLDNTSGDVRNAPFNLVTMCRDHHNYWERVSVLLQFMAFLPHPPISAGQTTLTAFGAVAD